MCRVVSPVRRKRRESFASVPGFPESAGAALCCSWTGLRSIATGRIFPGRPCSALPRHHYYSCPVLPLPQQDLSLSLFMFRGSASTVVV
jgi:hypothetical protein